MAKILQNEFVALSKRSTRKDCDFWLVKFNSVKYDRIVLLKYFEFPFKGLQWTDPWSAGKLGTSGCSWRYPERGGSSRAYVTSGMETDIEIQETSQYVWENGELPIDLWKL